MMTDNIQDLKDIIITLHKEYYNVAKTPEEKEYVKAQIRKHETQLVEILNGKNQ